MRILKKTAKLAILGVCAVPALHILYAAMWGFDYGYHTPGASTGGGAEAFRNRHKR